MSSNNSTEGATSKAADTSDKKGKGQKSSAERGTATNNKKNPGKRPHQGGSSR
jgi:hypothetical protein